MRARQNFGDWACLRGCMWAALRSSLFGASLRICALVLLLSLLSGTAAAQNSSASAAISGRVSDGDHKPVADAAIVVSGAASQKTVSDSSGSFQFKSLPAGQYRVTAVASSARTASKSIELAAGQSARMDLQLEDRPAAAQSSKAAGALSQAMQFADDPHFTVAGIADWTAAGGHGNDASLRTSEALTRETVDLQPGENPSSCPEDKSALQAAVARLPDSFEGNHCLGLYELRSGKYADAVQRLEAAYHLRPSNAENEYALAKAFEKDGEPSRAREHFQNLSTHQSAGNMHRLAGEVDESLGDPVSAVNEFAQAVRQDPTEQNYFAWGSELLYHRAVLQARDVFAQGVRAWPKSTRMLTALGAALFAGALYDDAAERLCQAATLEPDHPEPYLFMGRIEVAAPRPLPCVAEKLAVFHQRNPGNALADYYYAMALWKQRAASSDTSQQQQVAELLHQAVAADPGCGEAWLELGNLQAQSGDYTGAIPLYARAVAVKPQLSEAYYRLGVAYDRTGQREKARDYFAQHERIEKQQAAEVDQQRREIKQFVISSAGTNTSGLHPNH